MNNERHGALDDRAWTDFFTNSTRLTAVNHAEDPRPWLNLGAAGPTEMSSFIHEATHHWCFASPVASAISLLLRRARINAFRWLEADGNVPPKIARSILLDVVRADTAIRFLRPITEGLALYSEFDLTSGERSEVISPIASALIFYFADPGLPQAFEEKYGAKKATTMAVKMVTQRMRISDDTLTRKASLLLRPLGIDDGGYLPGYLAIKNLWRTAARHDPRLAFETDLFALYFTSFIYYDWGLVRALLTSEANTSSAATRVSQHISDRINKLESLTPEDVACFEQHLLANDAGWPTPGLLVSPDDENVGQALLKELTVELDHTVREFPIFGKLMANVTSRRRYMNLASSEVLCEFRNERLYVSWRDHEVLILDGDDLIGVSPVGKFSASLEVIFNAYGNFFDRVAVIVRDSTVVGCKYLGSDPGRAFDVRTSVIDSFYSRNSLTEIEETTRSAVEHVIDMTMHRAELDYIRRQFNGIIDDIYKDIALRFARDYKSIDYAAAVLASEAGLTRLVKGDLEVVRGLALFGLACSIMPDKDFIHAIFNVKGMDFCATLGALHAAYARYGYPPEILSDDGAVFTTI